MVISSNTLSSSLGRRSVIGLILGFDLKYKPSQKNEYSQRVQPQTSDESNKEHNANNKCHNFPQKSLCAIFQGLATNVHCVKNVHANYKRGITLPKMCFFQNIRSLLLGNHEFSLCASFQIFIFDNGTKECSQKIVKYSRGNNYVFKLIIQKILKVYFRDPNKITYRLNRHTQTYRHT